jgi:glucose-1-phosphate cytidylyltransferase
MQANNKKDIPVVILCGGQGSRLMEETESIPKPLVEIGGKPILWHIMKYYSCFGFKNFVLALGYKAHIIKQYFYNYRVLSSDFSIKLDMKHVPEVHKSSDENDWHVTCVDTGVDTLKGGRIKRLQPYLNKAKFMLTYGDSIGTVDLNALLNFHDKHGKIGTVTGVRPPSRFGEMRIDNGRVSRFEEKAQLGSATINGGFFVFKSDIFDYLAEDKDCDFEFGPLQKLSGEGELYAYEHKGFWQCMDNIREKHYLQSLWDKGDAPWKIWK